MSGHGKERLRICIQGAVQGVGFRPFVFRRARAHGLAGWVLNDGRGVRIEAEGVPEELRAFLVGLENDKPPHAVIQSLEATFLDPAGYTAFVIRESDATGGKSVFILPDIATCEECRREILDPANRRYRYPFTNCTHCGTRYSIIRALPYDRPNTSMAGFMMCPECQREYDDPADRRFHAQPNACPACGPQLAYWNARGETVAVREDAIGEAADALQGGKIVALKGIGGFQLLVDARDDAAVRRLRHRKHRNEKPFAVMYPDLADVQEACVVSPLERRLLESAEAPIVLLSRRDSTIAGSVAPGVPWLGVMLPYTPLHHLLMGDLGFPVVATSGNLSDEPICIDEHEALDRLGGIADAFLVHDRPIVRHVDDSVARVLLDREQVLRRARGYAPLPIHTAASLPNILGVGAHLKNTVALARGNEIFVSQHIGDLETPAAFDAFRAATEDLQNLYACRADTVACDLHPDCLSTQHARDLALPTVAVQHHHAHVLACMAENELAGPVLGVSWDGTGYGPDGTVWGGEFLVCRDGDYERVAHLRTFRLPGGDAAVKQPWRSALGVQFELQGEGAFSESTPPAIRQMLRTGLNSPLTSSAGRLFDAVAAILGLGDENSFEGQAAMALECAVTPGVEDAYPTHVDDSVDWGPTVEALMNDDAPVGVRAARFHNALTEAIVQVARRVDLPKVVLTGGCFQNRYLSEHTVLRLRAEGFQPYWHQRVPPNDGGIAVGQVMASYHAARVEKAPGKKAAMR